MPVALSYALKLKVFRNLSETAASIPEFSSVFFYYCLLKLLSNFSEVY